MASTPEGRVKDAVKKVLKDRGIWYFMPMQNGFGHVGIPDFICSWKGRFLAIETKAPGKERTVTPNQERCLSDIQIKGEGLAIVISDAATLASWLDVVDKFDTTTSKQYMRAVGV